MENIKIINSILQLFKKGIDNFKVKNFLIINPFTLWNKIKIMKK